MSLGCQPNPTDHLPGPLRDYFYACVSGNRSDPGDRPTPRDKIKGTRDKISRNAALSYRPSTVRSVPLTRPNFAPSFLPSRRSNIEKNHRSKILTGILFRFDRKVSLSNIENTREGIIALLLLSFDRKKVGRFNRGIISFRKIVYSFEEYSSLYTRLHRRMALKIKKINQRIKS